jgi:hypothetical protein
VSNINLNDAVIHQPPPPVDSVRNEGASNNLANIIESFKKEKSAFNERFSELKKRLDTFNQKRGGATGATSAAPTDMFNKTAPMSQTLKQMNGGAPTSPITTNS